MSMNKRTKFQVAFLKKGKVFPFTTSKKFTTHAIPGDFDILYFQFYRIRAVHTPIHAVPPALVQLDTATLPGEASDSRIKNWLLTLSVMSSVTPDNFAIHSKISSPGLSNAVLGSGIGPVVWQIIPPPNGVQGS